MKNAIYSKDEAIKTQYQERWLTMAEDVRAYIRNNCLETLGTETKRPSQAAQCVGYIACAELPRMLWPDCISKINFVFLNVGDEFLKKIKKKLFIKDRLMVNVTDVNASETLKESSLEAIGYICQDIVSFSFFFIELLWAKFKFTMFFLSPCFFYYCRSK